MESKYPYKTFHCLNEWYYSSYREKSLLFALNRTVWIPSIHETSATSRHILTTIHTQRRHSGANACIKIWFALVLWIDEWLCNTNDLVNLCIFTSCQHGVTIMLMTMCDAVLPSEKTPDYVRFYQIIIDWNFPNQQ